MLKKINERIEALRRIVAKLLPAGDEMFTTVHAITHEIAFLESLRAEIEARRKDRENRLAKTAWEKIPHPAEPVYEELSWLRGE